MYLHVLLTERYGIITPPAGTIAPCQLPGVQHFEPTQICSLHSHSAWLSCFAIYTLQYFLRDLESMVYCSFKKSSSFCPRNQNC